MECVSSNCLCGLAQVMPQNWKVVTYNIVLQRNKCGLENVLPKHSLSAVVSCSGEGQTPFTGPAERIPRVPEFQPMSGPCHLPQSLKAQISSSLQGCETMANCTPGVLWHSRSQGSFPKEVGNWSAVKTDEGSVDRAHFGVSLLIDERLTHVLPNGQVTAVKQATLQQV